MIENQETEEIKKPITITNKVAIIFTLGLAGCLIIQSSLIFCELTRLSQISSNITAALLIKMGALRARFSAKKNQAQTLAINARCCAPLPDKKKKTVTAANAA